MSAYDRDRSVTFCLTNNPRISWQMQTFFVSVFCWGSAGSLMSSRTVLIRRPGNLNHPQFCVLKLKRETGQELHVNLRPLLLLFRLF
jgi:hypothetical protein